MHTSGQFISSTMEMKPSKDDPQGRGSALTYMRRYMLASILGLNAEDDDGNKASKPEKVTKPKVDMDPDRGSADVIKGYIAKVDKTFEIERLEKLHAMIEKLKDPYRSDCLEHFKAKLTEIKSKYIVDPIN